MKKKFEAWALNLWWGTVAGGSTRLMWRNIGAKKERERIITLLEDYRKSITVQSASSAGGSWALQKGIALIKGENK